MIGWLPNIPIEWSKQYIEGGKSQYGKENQSQEDSAPIDELERAPQNDRVKWGVETSSEVKVETNLDTLLNL